MSTFDTTLTLIGGPTVVIELGGLRLVTDPTFDAPGTYPSGTIMLEKTTAPALSVAEIGAIDAVLLSHDQHSDNLDRAGRAFLPQVRTTLTTPIGASRLGGNAVGLAPWQTVTLDGTKGASLHVTAAPARHGPPGIEPIAGDVAGFLLGVDEPGDAIYITGDTVWYEGVAEVARRFKPKLVILFAGSAEPRGRFHLTMDANDALETAHAFPDAKIVAVHNEGWGHFAETDADLRQAFTTLGIGDRLVPLERGRLVRLSL
ncbi:MAG TPA: MBL fold metallo-hydrolase [Aliidongia sp.]|uniref:MBL fold metallo-hydrolase n=1 Tax=Aliidongia sp. TaxID=1914230 RepID=UPI002DDD82EA|nr:MBL fold metallo-hydrolase [Aliidongia sp.]HEV2676346.1 MBL fold metallo-hydrolase [Aliidongia sp.]